MRYGIILGLAAFFVVNDSACADEPLFPFVVSYDTTLGVTDLSEGLEKPAGRHGFVRIENGRMANDAGPVRFWATNLCFDACFPEPKQAQRLAKRLARFGFNCVRMHHMDAWSIWGKNPVKTTIDPEQLDRLDYLIYQLKLQGIHTNINLHVSRWLGDNEGFPHRDQRPNYDKGLGNFEPRMIELQKRYARELLTHVNQYTKTAYTDEPAVAMIEISNEDALMTTWNEGKMDRLPEPYATTYRGLWNDWLRAKYGRVEKLDKAWNVGCRPLGDEMLAAGRFSSNWQKHWYFQRDAQCLAETSIEPNGPDGRPFLRIEVQRLGLEPWVPQLYHFGLAVKKGTPYTLTFRLRADAKYRLGINAMRNHEPWGHLGLSTHVWAKTEWTSHRLTFLADQDDPDVRITFSEFEPGTYELADVSLRPGGIEGRESGERFDENSIPVLRRDELRKSAVARADFIDFLWDTERDYWHGMGRFLKDELGVQSLVSGTQLSYSPVHIQAGLDYIDAHAYWNHPSFPGRPWDRKNWYVRNRALVNNPGETLASLAARRVAGMAYTVSEYNHPAPNVYAAEGFPMVAAFGAFQSWDGIFPFTYSHNREYEPRKITGFFDIKGDSTRLVHMPACVTMFCRGDVDKAKRSIRVLLSKKIERDILHQSMTPWHLTAEYLGLDPRVSLVQGVGLCREPSEVASLPVVKKDTNRFVSDTGQLQWDVSEKGAGYFVVDTQRTKLFTGFVRGREFSLGEVTLRIGQTRLDWATISMVVVRGKSFDTPGSVLIAATGWTQNTNAKLEDLGGNRLTLRDRWGDAPQLCEGIAAEIVLPTSADRATLYPLDESGNRREPICLERVEGMVRVRLDPKYRTVWYELHTE